MKITEFREMALSFPGTIEKPHFNRSAYKIEDKRIFATLYEPDETANIRLPLADQATFTAMDQKMIYVVPNKWGLQGWTTFELKNIPNGLILDALNTAYQEVIKSAKKK